MKKKTLKVTALTVALLPAMGLAAIDDQGMQYVTAAEGLNGSLRVDILHNTSDDNNSNKDLSGGAENSLRLWVNGSTDLGGGLSSTYYWEIRSNEVGQSVGTNAWDLGLSGAFGDVEFGKLGMVAPRLVPSASLAFERGSNRASFAADPGDNGLRWESPRIKGLKVGVSAIIADNIVDGNGGNNDDSVDEWSFAANYESPLGFSVGAGYEFQGLLPSTISITNPSTDDKSGFRFGARYGQENWLVGYEYRGYEAFEGFSSVGSNGSMISGFPFSLINASLIIIGGPGGGDDIAPSALLNSDNVEYSVHAFGTQVKLDRITSTANYSVEKQKFGNGITDLKQSALAVDAAYALGSRSTMVIGWKTVDTEKHSPGPGSPLPDIVISGDGVAISSDVSETYLFYRVDF